MSRDVSRLCEASLTEAAGALARHEVSSIELTEAMLERIGRFDGHLRSFAAVCAERALRDAQRADEERHRGVRRGVLQGIPIALKDLIYTRGLVTACGSPMLRDWRPGFDATVVKRLRAAGAVLLGKLAMTEYAAAGYHPTALPPRNPWNDRHAPGVSSSGSGVAVAASLCFAALGTDTGGSIRMPAAACGVVGLKPTYGRISRHGVRPLADSLDHVGPMARTVADVAHMLVVVAGRDAADPATLHARVPRYAEPLARSVVGLRVGIDVDYCTEDVEPAVAAAVLESTRVLRDAGAEIVNVSVARVADVARYWLTVTGAEAAVAHQETYPTRSDEYGPVFRSILDVGYQAPAVDYARSVVARREAAAVLAHVFKQVDVFVCPAEPFSAPTWEQFPPQPHTPADRLPWVLRFAAPYNFTGNPTLALPGGFTEQGLPVELQFVGAWGREDTVLRAGHAYEQATDWHLRRPPPNWRSHEPV